MTVSQDCLQERTYVKKTKKYQINSVANPDPPESKLFCRFRHFVVRKAYKIIKRRDFKNTFI